METRKRSEEGVFCRYSGLRCFSRSMYIMPSIMEQGETQARLEQGKTTGSINVSSKAIECIVLNHSLKNLKKGKCSHEMKIYVLFKQL